MEISDLLLQAANLMLTGMVGVFIFLSILIFAVKGLSKLSTSKLSTSEQSPEQPRVKSKSQRQDTSGVPAQHVAAISAAIAQFRQNN
ncbi:OadG family protein [Pseudoalteromonas luteoviolacea]|uniref:OadG family protein n=1 Tax=Pseudoalteromonas luteoviolacea TaxID=43657 RepID=UPI0011509507|nr:OadG family transporter subunit [Pseudoalteromonas luteoviolacea]TQF69755.1 oxaloacetate decarboxylase [Pseudoalteromonas luteoviolacea]